MQRSVDRPRNSITVYHALCVWERMGAYLSLLVLLMNTLPELCIVPYTHCAACAGNTRVFVPSTSTWFMSEAIPVKHWNKYCALYSYVTSGGAPATVSCHTYLQHGICTTTTRMSASDSAAVVAAKSVEPLGQSAVALSVALTPVDLFTAVGPWKLSERRASSGTTWQCGSITTTCSVSSVILMVLVQFR